MLLLIVLLACVGTITPFGIFSLGGNGKGKYLQWVTTVNWHVMYFGDRKNQIKSDTTFDSHANVLLLEIRMFYKVVKWEKIHEI